MSKIKAKTVTVDQLEGLDAETLRTLCASFIQQRDTHKSMKAAFDRDERQRATMMPMAGAMMETLAERAGLAHNPQVRKMIEALGNGTYLYWGDETIDLEPLPADAEARPDPHSGDAEMAIGARLHDALTELNEVSTRMQMASHIQDALKELSVTVDRKLNDAIVTGFTDRGAPAPALLAEFVEPDQVAPIVSLVDAANHITDILIELDMGMTMLRSDLRAAMYRSLLRRLSMVSIGLHKGIEAGPTPAPQSQVSEEACN